MSRTGVQRACTSDAPHSGGRDQSLVREVNGCGAQPSLLLYRLQFFLLLGALGSRGWRLAVSAEDRFDVVPVLVDDERCVIPGVVMRAKARRAVVATAGFDSGAVELVNGSSAPPLS